MSFLNLKAGVVARAALLLALAFSATAANAAHPARKFFYTGGHDLDGARVAAIGDTYSTFTPDDAGWASVLSGASGPFDAILVGENSGSASPATQASIASYVSNGGRVIVASDHNGNVNFMNAVFGYATSVAYGCGFDDSVAGSLQPGAAGTTFAGGPPTVGNLSCTSALNLASVPAGAQTIYAGTGTSLAFGADYGSGRVVWLGWDYCCGGSTAQNDDWYLVLDNSIEFTGLFTTCAAEGYAGARLTLCRQVCEVPQTLTKLAGLVQLYTRTYRVAPPCGAVLATLP